MKPLAYAKLLTLSCSAMLMACSSAESNDPVKNDSKPAAKKETAATINIRYIDADSVSAHYNLAKDFKESSLRAFSKLESIQQSKAAEIQRFGSKIEENMRNNYYAGREKEYNDDMQRLNKMQRDAENYIANLQRNTQQELSQQQVELNDSLESFIKEYNAKKGYDAILFKAAGVYFNPSLDITQEVIDGLNARYNKVSASK